MMRYPAKDVAKLLNDICDMLNTYNGIQDSHATKLAEAKGIQSLFVHDGIRVVTENKLAQTGYRQKHAHPYLNKFS